MILDKLMEKKDLLAYIKFRKELLVASCSSNQLRFTPEKDREKLKANFMSRVKELDTLRVYVEQGILKRKGVKFCRELEARK